MTQPAARGRIRRYIAPGGLGVVLFAVGFIPLLGGPRYESALIAGILAPLWVGLTLTARWSAEARNLAGLIQCLQRAIRETLPFLGVLFLTNLIHQIIGGACEPWVGWVCLTLGPGAGCLVAAMLAAYASKLTTARSKNITVFLMLWGLCIGNSLWKLWAAPPVYAYNQLVGYFAGPIYDASTYRLGTFALFRTGTVLWLCLGVLAPCALRGTGRWPGRAGVLLLSSGLLVYYKHAPDLGIGRSTEQLIQALEGPIELGACQISFTSEVSEFAAGLLAQECDAHLQQGAEYLGVEPPHRVNVFVFASASQKREYMGAGRTQIAKPWLGQIYIEDLGYPHPVLGHELAHITTASIGTGPLKVAGSLGGWIPDPGRIEGFAVATSPQEQSIGTPSEWAAAMAEYRALPRLNELFQLGFFSLHPARSYSAAGSFVEFLHQRYGSKVLRRWYGGEDLEDLTKASWADLERAWRADLGTIAPSPMVLRAMQEKLRKKTIFQRPCPHASDRRERKLARECHTHPRQALPRVEELRALDPSRYDIELISATCQLSLGQVAAAEELLADQSHHPDRPLAVQLKAKSYLGQMAWQQGDLSQAKEHFEYLKDHSISAGTLRYAELNLWALKLEERHQEKFRKILTTVPGTKLSSLERGALLGTMLSDAEVGEVASYLLGRDILHAEPSDRESIRLAQKLLTDPASRERQLPSIALEKSRLRSGILATCALNDFARAKELFQGYRAQKLTAIEALESQRLEERCSSR
ncbi:MAG: tetratricopeptide repeat protein [Polyangiaceae bacterium]|nr:tetratricopeptide repeat protein [Polyangiaceae bacterium]